MPKPFLKWAGGKARLSETIRFFFPKKIRTYYEPFLGGGAVFFSLPPDQYEFAVLSDLNEDLIDTYRAVKSYPDSLAVILDAYASEYSKEFYLGLRGSAPDTLLNVAARFLFLNKTCFNGLYRENKKGQFNVPFGKRPKCPALYDKENLLADSTLLQNTSLWHSEFSIISGAGEGDVVYCDPPYVPTSDTSNFTQYQKGGFDLEQQQALVFACEDAAQRGATVILSNSEAALAALTWLAPWQFYTIEAKRSISASGASRKSVQEIIAVLTPQGESDGTNSGQSDVQDVDASEGLLPSEAGESGEKE